MNVQQQIYEFTTTKADLFNLCVVEFFLVVADCVRPGLRKSQVLTDVTLDPLESCKL